MELKFIKITSVHQKANRLTSNYLSHRFVDLALSKNTTRPLSFFYIIFCHRRIQPIGQLVLLDYIMGGKCKSAQGWKCARNVLKGADTQINSVNGVLLTRRNSKAKAVWLVDVGLPGGGNTLFLKAEEAHHRNIDAHAGKHFGLSKLEYLHWLRLDSAPLCGYRKGATISVVTNSGVEAFGPRTRRLAAANYSAWGRTTRVPAAVLLQASDWWNHTGPSGETCSLTVTEPAGLIRAMDAMRHT